MKALILDMDGVVVDSNPLHASIWRDYLTEHGLYRNGIMQWMHGKRNDQIVREVFGPSLSDAEVFAHGAAKEARYREQMRPQLEKHLVPGLRAFLDRWRHVPMGVGSNAEPANVEFVLEAAGLRPYFRAVVDGHQVTHPKPHPEIYLRVAELLGVSPKDCVIFEDSPGGIRAAREAGAKVVAVKTVPGAVLPETDYQVENFADPGLDNWLCST
jgi:HAD superfamily hydrolase (TIGR01509 family)